MIKRIGALFIAIAMLGIIMGLFGCATPPPRESGSPELGELRGGAGKPLSERYDPWTHPTVVP